MCYFFARITPHARYTAYCRRLNSNRLRYPDALLDFAICRTTLTQSSRIPSFRIGKITTNEIIYPIYCQIVMTKPTIILLRKRNFIQFHPLFVRVVYRKGFGPLDNSKMFSDHGLEGLEERRMIQRLEVFRELRTFSLRD